MLPNDFLDYCHLSLYSTRTHRVSPYSGTFASPNAKDSTFALPNAKNTNMLISFALGDANFLRWPCTFHFFVYIPFASGSQREPHFQWNIGGVGSSGVGHVHFMYISCCLCIIFRVGYAKISRRRGKFRWNMGFTRMFIILLCTLSYG